MVVTSASESPEERDRWAEAERIGRLLRADPLSVSPEYAGDLGFQRVDDLDEEAPDFADRLDLVGCLLRFAVTGAPDAVRGGWWRIELARVLGQTALTTAAPGAWDASAHWAGAALDFPHLSIEERDEITVEVAEIYCCRADAVMDAWQSGDVSDHDFLHACGTLLRLLDDLGGSTPNPGVRALIDLMRARTHAYRWDITDEAAELHRAVGLQSWALQVVPDGYPGLTDELMLFAELCRSGYQAAPEHVPLALAVQACRRLITLTLVEGEILPEHHLLLARLLMLREDSESLAVQDEIVDSLAVAAGMDDEFVWWMYGDALLDRGCEADDVDDLEDALLWLGHSVDGVTEDAEWVWMAEVGIARAHFRLLKVTGELSHVDQVVWHVTRLLDTFDLDGEVVHDLHAWRLFALMDLAENSDPGAWAAQYPVAAWLRESVRVVDGQAASGLLTEIDGVVALCVALLWSTVLAGASDAVVADVNGLASALEDSARMLGLAVDHLDLADEDRTDVTLKVAQESLENQVRMLRGQTDVDLSVASAVLNDAALHRLHRDVASMTGGLLASAAGRMDSLGAFDVGASLLKHAGPQALSGLESDQLEAVGALVAFFRAATAGGGVQQLREAGNAARELMVTTTFPQAMAPMVGLAELASWTMSDPHSRPSQLPDRPAPAWMRPMMVMLRLLQEFATAAQNSDLQALREIAATAGEFAQPNANSEYWLKYARELHGIVHATLANLEPDDAELLATAIAVLEQNWSERGAGRDLLLDRPARQFGRLLRRRDLPGDRARSREMGRYATWSAGWKVALQSENEHGFEIARNGVAAADELVAWCLEDSAVHDLVRALDARRGLVLKAAHIGRVVAHRLGAIGRHDLAEEWVEAEGRDRLRLRGPDGELSDWGGLRRKVLGVLTEGGDMSADPHFLDRVRRALHAHGSHCLVYLVPSNEHHEGLVVVVPADGEPSFSTCPELLTAQDSAVARYQSAYDAWYEARTDDGEEYERWKDELDRICRWADDVAGAQLRRAADGRDRVVLVPVGSLGLVPWHAAKRVAAGVDRYLVQDLEISYAPSAELFCDVVERRPVEGGNPLLVGNPARDLPSGVVEAWSVRDAFYSGGLVMGSWSWFPLPSEPADDGAGTPDEVVSALADPLPLLHLACHAVADMKEPLESRICLAGGTLSAQRLMDVRPTEVLPIGLVVLAGCTTNVSGVDYDEALSLSTSFLSLGARTVVGSMWKVPAGRTTVQLMFMFHHYLRVEGLSSSSALRRAQLWMLDPGREFPSSMPGKVRDMAHARGFDHADAVCWAGFTQQGV